MLEGKNKVLESIAPHIYDRYAEKLGLLLALIGGVPKQQGDDPRTRAPASSIQSFPSLNAATVRPAEVVPIPVV